MKRQNGLRVTLTRIASLLLGLSPFVVGAQSSDVPLPNVQITPLTQPHGFLAATPAVTDDPRMLVLADRLKFALDEIEAARTSSAAPQKFPRAMAAANAATTSTMANLTSRKAVRLVGNGPGNPITAIKRPKYQAKFSKAGTISAVTALPGQVLQKAVGGIGSESHTKTVQTFFRAQQSTLGLADPENELRLHSSQTDKLGHSHYRYGQDFKGVPVWGAELIAQLNQQGDLISINGVYSPTPRKLTIQPTVSKQQALFSVKTKFQSVTDINEPELIVFLQDRLIPRLAWHFEFHVSAIENRLVILDAHDGSELLSINQVQTGQASGEGVDLFGQTQMFNSSLWEEGGIHYLIDTTKPMFDPGSLAPTLPGVGSGLIVIADAVNSTDPKPSGFIVSSNIGPTGPWLRDGVSAAINLSATYDYFLQRHGRNSLDGSGSSLIGLVRVGQGYSGASFDPSTQEMKFGDADNYAGALDVVGHEMAHGVIETSIPGGLLYFGQSGALNESFADIFGEMAEQHFNQTNPDWLMGTRLSTPLRNMMNPGAIDIVTGRPYPSKMSEFVWPDDNVLNNFVDKDNNGVHINSSIINHAFYLLTNGANGISLQDAESIFYRALTTKLSALSEFVDMRFAAIQSATELFGPNSPQAQQTAAAFDAVEVFETPTNPTPPPFPAVAGPDGTLFVYWDSSVGDYFLGRLDPALGDIAPGIQLSSNPVWPSSPSVSGDGLFAVYVNAQQDICLKATDGSVPESCLGFPGEIASVAMAPDGDALGLVFLDPQGNPSNTIGVIDIAANQQQLFSLVSPNIDGASSIDVIQADAMDFTSDNRFIVYDAFNAINFNDGSNVGLWSIYAIDLFTGATITLTVPKQGFNTAYPNIAQTSDGHMAFDFFDNFRSLNTVVAVNLYTGDAMPIASTGSFFSAPVYTGDDSGIVYGYEDINVPTGASLRLAPVGTDRITPSGASQAWLSDATFGAIYRRGTFTPPPEVDIAVTYSALAFSGHVATFELALANNGVDEATNVAWSVSLPPNVNAMVTNYGGTPNCTILADRIECQTTAINAGATTFSRFEYTLTSFSSSGEIVSSVTAFADQPDTNSPDNTSIVSVSEANLNATPVMVTPQTDQTLTENVSVYLPMSVNFNDSDGDQLIYTAVGLPPSLSINTDNGNILGIPTAAEVGNTFVVTVTATDPLGTSASDSFNLSVVSASSNQTPTANAGADRSVNEGTTVNLAGSGTDSDGTIVAYSWQQESGTPVTITNANGASASFTAPLVSASEVLGFRLTVTDDDGATGSDTVSVTVNDVSLPPPQEVDIGITYTGSALPNSHVGVFNLMIRNNGQRRATDVAVSASVPPNASAFVSNDGFTSCTLLSDRILCRATAIDVGSAVFLEFQLSLTSFSSSAEIASTATAFPSETDQNSQDNTSVATVSESDLNATPILVAPSPDKTLTQNVSADFSVSSNFEDTDGDALTYSQSGLPGSLSLNSASGSIVGTPTASNAGNTYAVTVTATDALGASASDSFNMRVNPTPGSPSSSGGGGGSAGFLSLAALLTLALRRKRRLCVGSGTYA